MPWCILSLMVYCIVMQEGLANVCLVTSAMTITRAKIERKIPKKDMVSISNYLQLYFHGFTYPTRFFCKKSNSKFESIFSNLTCIPS